MGLEETGCEGVDWIHMTHDRDRWRAVVNTVMNIWLDKRLLESEEVLYGVN